MSETIPPLNLINKLSSASVDAREFTDPETKNVIKYDRLVLEVLVRGEPVTLEFKIDKKDKAVLTVADTLNTGVFNRGDEG